jgi:peptidoglycan-N-acetylglucosamine deacetylase
MAASNEMLVASQARVTVTTSWDDEAASGLRVAELLAARGLPGTFYVPTAKLGTQSALSTTDLRTLSAGGFEIGGHTVSHKLLTTLSQPELAREVGECKSSLEQILGKAVTSFCYPKGRFNAQVVSEVRKAGYYGARTTKMLSMDASFRPFEMPVTVQAFPHTRMNYVRNLVRLGGFPALAKSASDLISFDGWLLLGKKLFDRTLRNGGVWHLYGHPWEIERLNLWSQLAEMLDYVSNCENVAYLTNGQLFSPATAGRQLAGGESASNPEYSRVN